MKRVTRSSSRRNLTESPVTSPPRKKQKLSVKKEIKIEADETNNNKIIEADDKKNIKLLDLDDGNSKSSGYSSDSGSIQQKSPVKEDASWGGISEFERKAMEAKKARMQMLMDMGVMDAKFSFEQSAPKKPVKIKTIKTSPKNTEPRRKSARLQLQEPHFKPMSYQEHISAEKACHQRPERFSEYSTRHDPGPCHLSALSKSEDIEDKKTFLESIAFPGNDESIQYWNQDLSRLTNTFKKMRCRDVDVAKLVPNRICSLFVYPSDGRSLVLAGDTNGSLGIWDLSGDRGKLGFFNLHTCCLYCITKDKRNPSSIYTSSYDGSLRQFDFPTGITQQVYGFENDEMGYSCHAQLTDNSMLITGRKKIIDHIDLRTKKCIGSYRILQSGRTKVVTVHPTNENYFATAGGSTEVSLWDRRSMKKSPTCVTSFNHSKSVQGLEFSPVSGNFLLSTSWDDSIYITKFEENKTLKVVTRVRHCNNTGRWLTPFKATWVPDQEEAFVVGSLLQPRRTQLFDRFGNLLHDLKSDNVNSVNSVLAFHPSKPLLVGGNSSGRVHIFE